MIAQKNHNNETKTWQEGLKIMVDFARFYYCWGATEYFPYQPVMDRYMIENKNIKIELQLSYKYQSLSYCLVLRSILGCFAILRLWGSPWWRLNLHVRFDQISKYLVYFTYHLLPRQSYTPAWPPGLFTSTYYCSELTRSLCWFVTLSRQ